MQIKNHFRAIYLLACLFGATSAMAQPSLSKVFIPNNISSGSHSEITFTITNGSASPVTDLSFTDVLPAAVSIGNPGIPFTDCDLDNSGSLTANNGGSTISLSGGELGAFESCTITLVVTSSTLGDHTNPAVTLSSSAGSSMSLPVDLTVADDRPSFSKSFSPSSIPFGSRSTLTFSIDNSLNAAMTTNLRFTDVLPTGLEIADPSALSTTCNGAAITATPGTSIIEMTGTSILNAGTTCDISLDVVGTNIGSANNQTSDFTSTNGFSQLSSGMAVASLELTGTPISLTKSFENDPVVPGSNVELSFTIRNFNRNFSASNLAFTDDLTAMVPMLIGLAYDSLVFNDCGGSVSGVGTTLINFTGGNLSPESSCQIRVLLSIPLSAAAGTYTNTTNSITGNVDGNIVSGNQASDDLFINFAPVFTKEFIDDPTSAGGSTTLRFTITNTNPNSALTDFSFSDDIGGVDFQRNGAVPNMSANGLIAAGGLQPQPLLDPCGAGSVLTIPDPNDTNPSPPFPEFPPDPTLLNFTGGNLAAAGSPGDSCTFDVVLDVPLETPSGTYTNTTTNLATTTEIYTPATDDLVVIAAPALTKFFSDDPVAPGSSVTMEFRLINSENATSDATNISFTDDMSFLPGAVVNLPPIPNPPCGSGSTLTAPGNVLTLAGASLMPAEECSFSVTVDVPAATTPGIYTNTTSDVTATVGGMTVSSEAASADLNVSGLLFSKSFTNDPVIAGDTVTLRFEIENIHPTENATNIFFTDALSDVLPGTPDLTAILPPTSDTCGGTMSGTTFMIYSGGAVNSGNSCTIDIDILVPAGAADGQYNNVTSQLTATQNGNVTVEPAADILEINSTVIELSKSFTDDPVNPGNQVTLEFTVTNIDNSSAISGISFTDDLDAALTGLTATGLPANNVCGAGSQLSGTSLLNLTGGNLAAGSSCTFAVTLQVPLSATPGNYLNTTSSASGTLNGFPVTSDPASDTLNVTNAISFDMSFDGPTTATGTAVITFNINNASTINTSTMAFINDLDLVIPGLVATGLPATDVCGTGSQLTGSSVINFTGGNLLAGTGCSFDVTVQVPVSATAGMYPSTTSDLTDNGLFVAEPANSSLTIEPPPTFSKQFSMSQIGIGQVTTLQFNIDNSASALAADNLDFIDNFPAGMVIANPTNASSTCTGGTLTATAGTGTLSYTGGSVTAGATCGVSIDVTSIVSGSLVNTTGDLTSTSGNSGTATDTLTVNPQPGFSKSFSPNPTAVNAVVALTLSIDNTASTVAATGLDFTDNFPAGLVVATPANASTTCTGGTLSAISGNPTVSYTGGTVAAGSSCSVVVDVTASAAGDYVNVTGDLTSSLGNSGTTTDTLTVSDALLFTKSFSPDVILSGDNTTLVFTLNNSSNNQAATSVDFIDTMPAEIVIATPANLINTCTGGTLTAASGTSTISYSGGMVAANTTCNISVDVTSFNIGSHINITGDLTSSLGNSGSATDTLNVEAGLTMTKSFVGNSVNAGGNIEMILELTNQSSQAATQISFDDDLSAFVAGATSQNLPINDACGLGSSVTGSNLISLNNGSLTAGGSCQINVMVTIPDNTPPGSYTNTTGPITANIGGNSVDGGTGSTDSATLSINGTLMMVPTLNQWWMLLLILMVFMVGHHCLVKR
jgi:hypothetical protein